MNDWEKLETFGNVPVDIALLKSCFSDYASPSGKVEELCRNGLLSRTRRGLYVVAPKISHKPVSAFLTANHLYGPSYISLETALEYHDMIPEAVHETRSVTLRRAKKYDTGLGRFSYYRVPDIYFRTGILMAGAGDERFLIASPEKALCDLLMLTNGLRIQSARAMRDYLENFLRIDMDVVAGFNTEIIRECIETGRKRTTLRQLLEVVKNG